MSDAAAPQKNTAPASDKTFVKAFIPGLILGLVVGGLGGAFLIPFLSDDVPTMPKSVPPAPGTNPAARDRDARPADPVVPKPGDKVEPKLPATTPATIPPAPK